jgi:hypothetical protein
MRVSANHCCAQKCRVYCNVYYLKVQERSLKALNAGPELLNPTLLKALRRRRPPAARPRARRHCRRTDRRSRTPRAPRGRGGSARARRQLAAGPSLGAGRGRGRRAGLGRADRRRLARAGRLPARGVERSPRAAAAQAARRSSSVVAPPPTASGSRTLSGCATCSSAVAVGWPTIRTLCFSRVCVLDLCEMGPRTCVRWATPRSRPPWGENLYRLPQEPKELRQ